MLTVPHTSGQRPPSRMIAQYILTPLPPPLNKVVFATNNTIKREVINSIRLYSEIKDLGKDILTRHGHVTLTYSFDRFQAYVRQSLTFFEAAEALHYRASPLLYYYSFMNFVKAIIFLHDPTFTSGHINHGISPNRKMVGTLGNHVVTAAQGVFSHFYQHITNTTIPNGTRLRMQNLLSYVSDIGFEYQYLKMGNLSWMGCKYAIVQYANEKNRCRALIAVTRPSRRTIKVCPVY